MSRFVSEPVTPVGDTTDTAALARAEPSLPEGFEWRGRTHAIQEVLEVSKGLREEGFSGETYLRRHEWKLRMKDGAIWSVYFLRQPESGRGRRGRRWFLKTIDKDSG